MPSAALRLRDYRRLVALTHECRELGDDVTLWRSHLARELGRWTGADLVTFGELALGPGGSVVPIGFIEWGWENGLDHTAFAKATAEYGADMGFSPLIAGAIARRDEVERDALTRTELLTDRAWYATPYFRLVHKPIGLDHCALSFVCPPGLPGVTNGLALSRGGDVRQNFSNRDRKLLGEANAVLSPLIGGPLARFSEPSPTALPPRVRQVLRCLLEGDGDKQIANRLGISLHTVNQYTKTLYRHFGVTTRSELLARWVRRGWGTKFAWDANPPE